jgi:hypothetical protein
MSRLAARRLRGEEGASLIIAMAFIVLFSLLLTALLSFATTSFSSQSTIQKNIKASAAAAAAIDTAVAKVRQDPTMLLGGDPASTPAGSCGGTLLTYTPTSGAAVPVTCTAVAGTDTVQPGVGGPANALLTLGGGGITANGAGVVKTAGSVFSTAGINLGSATLDATDYATTAQGACTPAPNADPTASLTPWLAVNTQCNAPATAAQIGDGANPAADPRYNSRTADVPSSPADFNPVPTSAGNCTGRTLTFKPGHYTDPTWFSTAKWPLVVCGAGTLANVLYFSPGAYYFDFGANGESNLWNVQTATVIGGKRSAGYTGNAAPAAITPDAAPANCVNDATAGQFSGVQFILGGASQIVLSSGAKMELCPRVDAKGFGIPIVGLPSTDPGVGGIINGTARLVPRTAVTPVGTPAQVTTCTAGSVSATQFAFSGGAGTAGLVPVPLAPGGTPIDNSVAQAGGNTVATAVPAGAVASALMCGLDWAGNAAAPTVPTGSTITAVTLDVAHQELPCLGTSSNADGLGGTGPCTAASRPPDPNEGPETGNKGDCDNDDPCLGAALNVSITANVVTSSGNCAVTITPRNTLGTDALQSCVGGLINSTSLATFLSTMRITYSVTVNGSPATSPAAQAFLDGIVVHVNYTAPTFRPGNGCGAPPCQELSTVNVGGVNAPVLATWGTGYFPEGVLTLGFSSTSKIAFDRGLIASTVTLGGLPAADNGKGRFRLGTGGSGRTFILTAQSGTQKVSARIRVVDSASAAPHGFAVAVREWSTAP